MPSSPRPPADDHRQRRVCVFTGSRADYGPVSPLLRRLREDPGIDLRMLVSGGHLVPDQGLTVRTIEEDGHTVDERVDVVLASDDPSAVAKSFGLACIGYVDALTRISPDILVLLGDRYETFAAAVAALPMMITIAHIGGGQLTYGSNDDQIRHAITKLSHLHFTVTADDRRRLIQMGEDPRRVFEVNTIGLDPVVLNGLLSRTALEGELGIELGSPTFLITHHPATSDPAGSRESLDGLLAALDRFAEATLVFTAPNVDNGSREIGDRIRAYVRRRGERAAFVASLGQRRYLSLLKHADVVIGNSSSGVTEAPVVGTPTVNIGTRQDGRVRAPSVVDCAETADEIAAAIARCRSIGHSVANPVSTSEIDRGLDRMVAVLKDIELAGHTAKRFFNVRDYREDSPSGSAGRREDMGATG